MKRLLAGLVLLLLAAFAFVIWQLGMTTTPPPGARVEIARGTGTRQIAAQLRAAGVIRDPNLFLAARTWKQAKLQAGEYVFEKPATVWQVIDRLKRGDTFQFEATIPEGSNRYDIARILAAAGVVDAQSFVEASADPTLVRDLAPRAPTLEGFLFPATYRFPRHTTAKTVCREMVISFRRAWKQAGGDQDALKYVTMASLVEKETGVAAERPVVASVFWNRIGKKMKLDCDPTVMYAALIEGRWRGKIYRSDLDREHPYNTYRTAGLPPGPIANPGLKSMEAALRPEQTQYLYFVARADGSGGHNFSADIAGHQKAVEHYRRAVKKNAAD
ncbi:MAG: endolytic transglycosylase MltG [Bryobacteraceae bacterium]|nr:endolytic transglycosylase MltG [Bryobacteraceae bacterium]